jgi:hypothetical protein
VSPGITAETAATSLSRLWFGVEMSDGWLFETAQVKLAGWMELFGNMFTAPTWRRVLVVLIGAVLSPGRRTVAAALRVTGLDQDPHFTIYHRVPNRSRWSSRQAARCLSRLLVSTFVPSGPVIIGLDDTLERRGVPRCRSRDLPRSNPVQSWPFRHGERVALVLDHDPAGDRLGRARRS